MKLRWLTCESPHNSFDLYEGAEGEKEEEKKKKMKKKQMMMTKKKEKKMKNRAFLKNVFHKQEEKMQEKK